MKNYIEQLQADLDHAAETGNDRVSTDFDTANNALCEIDRLRADNTEMQSILTDILNGSGYPSYALASQARAIIAKANETKPT